jgi:hypothetical protein
VADRPLSTALRVRYRLTPWWVKVIVVFVLSRIVTTAILLETAARQLQNPWTGAQPDYFDYAKIWDGHWYYIISLAGYPADLPMTPDGHVGESAWAFMPAYPAVARLFMIVTGLDFAIVAPSLSTLFALGAALLFYRVIARVQPGSVALFSVVLFCVAPLSPILQVSYAESMQLFLLALALLLLMQRQYWMMLPVVTVLSLTRPSGLAFALAMLMHAIHRWVTRRRDPFPVRERVGVVVVGLWSFLSGAGWLLIAWAVTGSMTAYLDTELAWRRPYIGDKELVPFWPWIEGARFWQQFLVFPLAYVILILLVAGFVAFMFTPWMRRLGPDLRFWTASYALYLLAVFFPQSSTFRLLMPLFPALGAVAQVRPPAVRVLIVVACVAGQWFWVQIGWFVNGYDWTPP